MGGFQDQNRILFYIDLTQLLNSTVFMPQI